MSIAIMSAIWKNGPSNSTQRFVLLALADNANDEGRCYPSLQTIATKCALSKRAVSKAIDQLEADGYLSHRRRFNEKGAPTSNEYHIHGEPLGIQSGNDVDRGMEPDSSGVGNVVLYPMERDSIGVGNVVHGGMEPRAHKPSINHQYNHQGTVKQKKQKQLVQRPAVPAAAAASEQVLSELGIAINPTTRKLLERPPEYIRAHVEAAGQGRIGLAIRRMLDGDPAPFPTRACSLCGGAHDRDACPYGALVTR